MQNRYVGDIGDYLKLALLRALQPEYELGVCWWLYPDQSHNRDGRHIRYLDEPEKWRAIDGIVFDRLKEVVVSGDRRVSALEDESMLKGARFFSEPIPAFGTSKVRRLERQRWFDRLQEEMKPCNLVFLDPDNGLETKNFDIGAAAAGKSVALSELGQLRKEGRSLLVYHHHTRRTGGHIAELQYWGKRLREDGFAAVDALRASPYSPRAYFLLDGSLDLQNRCEAIVAKWGWKRITWHPRLGLDQHALLVGDS